MLLNYLKLSLRLLARNPFFTGINVIGLAIGFASFYALWEYSTTELKSDQYHQGADRIVRIGSNWQWFEDSKGEWGHLTIGFSNFLPRVREEFPEVESYVRILHQPDFGPRQTLNHREEIIITIDDRKKSEVFKVEKAVYADPNLFTFFTIPLVYGQPDKVLEQTNNVVLSQSVASKYFGAIDPTGELIRLNDSTTLNVSGVYEDLPHNSHLDFEMVFSNVGREDVWNSFNNTDVWAAMGEFQFYAKLNVDDFRSFETKLNNRAKEYYAQAKGLLGGLRKLDFFVQPLSEIAFGENFAGDYFYSKSKPFLFTLVLIAISVMAMAWINYVNLSITRTTRRFKEIATRKVSGASTKEMVGQFVTEAMVTNVFAIAVAATLIQVIRAPVAIFFKIPIAEFSAISWQSGIIFLGVIISGILLSGLYPAVISMSYKPRSLFNMSSLPSRKRFMPAILTVGQLTAAAVFIMLGLVVYLQLNHILSMDTGLNKDQVLVVDAPVIKPSNYMVAINSFKDQILSNTKATMVSCTKGVATEPTSGGFGLTRKGASSGNGFDGNCVDEDFVPLFGIKLLGGRAFMANDRPDVVMVSRVATERMGFTSPQDAIGTTVITNWPAKEAEVIGVFEDYRLNPFFDVGESQSQGNGRGISLLYKDQLLGLNFSAPKKISIKVQPENFQETINSIQELYEQQFPGNVFNWYFLDEHANLVYANEKVARNQIVVFTVLALIISCLGMLGMISNKVVEKTKEIGIRKVMGAQLHQIAQILLNTTVKQIAIASMISIPVASYLIQQYLEKYSERITLQWWHFALPILILVVIMFSTIATVLWKAAKNNPVEALKYE